MPDTRVGALSAILRRRRTLVMVVPVLGLAACARAIAPLRGTPAPPGSIPVLALSGSRHIVFRWEFNEDAMVARGEGVARLTAPDSARLDFFVDGGFGSGSALVFGDRVVAPGGNLVQGMLPSAPMLWAAVGRLAVPPSADTIAAIDGSVLRADIGGSPRWRVAITDGRLAMLERVDGDRVSERLTRSDNGTVLYANTAARRTLKITITRQEEVPGFDASIWRP
jgi:hypothetical protein